MNEIQPHRQVPIISNEKQRDVPEPPNEPEYQARDNSTVVTLELFKSIPPPTEFLLNATHYKIKKKSGNKNQRIGQPR